MRAGTGEREASEAIISKAMRNHRVAGEDGHGFAEDFMVGRATTAEVVVVHGGKIVMDETERVN